MRLSKEELARFSGAEWGVRLVEERGLDGAKEELRLREIKGIPLKANTGDLEKFCEEEKSNTIVTVMLMTAITLRDEYGFGKDRLHRFIERFNQKTECLIGHFVNWQEIQETLFEETGIKIELPEVFQERA